MAIRKYRPVHQAVVGVAKHQVRAVASVAHFSLDSFLPLVVVFPEALLMANVSCWVTGVRAQVIADPTNRVAVASVAHFSLDSFLPLVFPEALLMANVSWVTGVRAQVTDQVMATGFLMACAYLHPTVIRETMAPRVLERVVSFSCPNESGCRYT